ncbi:MAG: CPBP family intramembrane metalloprotease [Oscillospiraceae bacterium]|nr:CPBP family intramembrane metalloprotease [Oscillospiraceae bacterium]
MEDKTPVFGERKPPDFTSRMDRWQIWVMLLYLPIHAFGLPLLMGLACERGYMGLGMANFWIYAVGFVLTVAVLWRFLRRDLDPLLDRAFVSLIEILRCYALIWCGELIAAMFLSFFGVEGDAANNEQAIALLREEYGPMVAATVFLAPVVEECLFRGALFGSLRHKNRALAYAVSALAFCLYHVAAYALADPKQLLFILEYIPAGLALALCYERTDSIWGPIFLHMLNNGVSIWVVTHA